MGFVVVRGETSPRAGSACLPPEPQDSPLELFLGCSVRCATDLDLHLLEQVPGLPQEGIDVRQLRSLFH